MTQQQLHNFRMPKGTGIVQGDQTPIIPCVNISSALQQVLDNIFPPKTCKEMETFVEKFSRE